MKFKLFALFTIFFFLLTLPLVFSAVVEITIEYGVGVDWEVTPTSFATKSGVISTNVTLGTFKINNTGSKALNFQLIPNQTWIRFNISSPFSLNVGESRVVQVNATVPSTAGTYDYSILINSTTAGVSPSQQTITGSLIATLTTQPYLVLEMTYPSCAEISSSISLKAKVTNTGSGNATNVWLNWTLPAGWVITGGSQNVFVSNLGVDSSLSNEITVTTGASKGSYTITAKTNSSEGVGATDSKTVTLHKCGDGTCDSLCESCSSCEADCGACPSPGPGPGPGPAPTIIAWSFVVDSYIEVFENESAIKNILVKNEGNVDLHNLKVSVIGLASDWYGIEPSEYPRAIPGETKSFIITYTPKTKGTYNFNIEIGSLELSNTTSVTLLVKELPPAGAACGNRVCEPNENCTTCPQDCGICPEEIAKKLEIIKPMLIITGIIAPAIIAAYMLVTIMVRRCPVCGSKLILGYRGKFVVSYKCSKCEYFEIKEAGK